MVLTIIVRVSLVAYDRRHKNQKQREKKKATNKHEHNLIELVTMWIVFFLIVRHTDHRQRFSRSF